MFKHLIMTGGALATVAAFSSNISAAMHDEHVSNTHHELGLQLYSLRNHFPDNFENTVKQIQAWDIQAVEGGGMLHGQSIDGYKAAFDEAGIKVVSVDTSYEEVRDNAIAVAYKARFFGAKYATIYWAPHDGTKGFSLQDADDLIALLNSAGAELKKQGITLQYHPHGYEFAQHKDGTLLDYIIQSTKHAQFQMDVFWIKQGGADPLEVLKKYEGRFTSLHLKDREIGTPNSSTGSADVETNVVLGSGDVGISALVKEAKRQGIHYFFLEDESSRVLTQIPQSMAFVKPLIE